MPDANKLATNTTSASTTKCSKIFFGGIKRWSARSSIHGFSHAGSSQSKKILCFWLASFIVCGGSLIYFLSIRLTHYVNSGVVTSLSYVFEPEIKLPDVSLCLHNDFDMTSQYFIMVIVLDILQVSWLSYWVLLLLCQEFSDLFCNYNSKFFPAWYHGAMAQSNRTKTDIHAIENFTKCDMTMF